VHCFSLLQKLEICILFLQNKSQSTLWLLLLCSINSTSKRQLTTVQKQLSPRRKYPEILAGLLPVVGPTRRHEYVSERDGVSDQIQLSIFKSQKIESDSKCTCPHSLNLPMNWPLLWRYHRCGPRLSGAPRIPLPFLLFYRLARKQITCQIKYVNTQTPTCDTFSCTVRSASSHHLQRG